jgi:hypothetical protein
MATWIRQLIRPAGASSQWHAQGPKSFVVSAAVCGERFAGAVEVTPHEDKTDRDGRCANCETLLAERAAAREASETGAAR